MNYFNTIDDIPDIPVVKTAEEHKALCAELISCGAIAKKDLKINSIYEGSCRNSSTAKWNGKEFEYMRSKWGNTYLDTVPHFEDEMYYDVFIPIKEII